MKRRSTPRGALLLAVALAGCNAFGPADDENDANEVSVSIQALGSSHIDADDGIRYQVDANTTYEGYAGFADLAVGTKVDIEFEEIAGSDDRRALEVEDPTAPDVD